MLVLAEDTVNSLLVARQYTLCNSPVSHGVVISSLGLVGLDEHSASCGFAAKMPSEFGPPSTV